MAVLGAGAGQALAATETRSVMVRFDAGATSADRRAVGADLGSDAGTPLLAGWRVYRLDDPLTLAALRADVSGDAGVAAVALDTTGGVATNDPLYVDQWALRNTGQTAGSPAVAGTSGADVDYETAVRRVPARSAVTVAVVDTGLEMTHPDLSGQLWTNTAETPGNGVDDDHNGYVDDVHGWNVPGANGDPAAGATSHGTQVAGIIAATPDNGRGIAGVASNARIMAVKIGETGAQFPWSQVIAGLAYVRKFPEARVVNLSLGGTYSQPLCDAVAQMTAEGRIVVVASGNNNTNLSNTAYAPATCAASTLVTVGASTHTDARAGFSNYSATQVDLFAPGYWMPWQSAGGTTTAGNGTSFAAPMVSGAAAFVLGADPSLSAAAFRTAVMAGGDRMDPPGATTTSVSGNRMDMAGLLDRLAIGTPDTHAPGTVPLTAPAAGAWTDGAPVLSWDAATDDVAVTGYEVLLDGVKVATVAGREWRPATPLGDGTHTWGVRACDAAGNVGAASSRSVQVDNVVPAAVVLDSPAASATVTPGTVRFAWSGGADAGPVHYLLSVDGRTVADTGAREARVEVDEGEVSWSVTAVDAAGNVRTGEVRTLMVTAPAADTPDPVDADQDPGDPDASPLGPGAVRINGGAAWTASSEVTLTLEVPDGATHMRIDTASTDGAWVPAAARARTRLPAGAGTRAVTVTFRAADGTLGAPVTDRIGVDTSAPVVASATVRQVGAAAVRVTVRARDAGAGLARLRVGARSVALAGAAATGGVTVPRTARGYTVVLTDAVGRTTSRRLSATAR